MRATGDEAERMRLLDSEASHLYGSVQEDNSAEHVDSHDEDDAPLAEEASTKELLAVMGAIWMGVFFAALGTMPIYVSTQEVC